MEVRENNAIPNELQTGDKVVISDGIHIWGGRTGVVKSFDENNPRRNTRCVMPYTRNLLRRTSQRMRFNVVAMAVMIDVITEIHNVQLTGSFNYKAYEYKFDDIRSSDLDFGLQPERVKIA